MSGRSVRLLAGVLLCSLFVACGGGGGGGGGGTSSVAPLDTDRDGHPDSTDAFPNDPSEWLDSDRDGVGDNADTDPLGQAIPAWTTYQANAKHSGHIDITLTTSNFKQRWSTNLALSSAIPGAAGDGYIFLNQGGQLIALDARTGTTLWTQSLAGDSFYGLNQPAYADGIVYVQTGGHEDAFLWAFTAANGAPVFKTKLEDQWSSFFPPTIVDGTVYIAGGYYGGMYAIDAKTGAQKWWQTLNQYDQFTPAISGGYAIAYTGQYSPKLTVANRLTGNVDFEIPDPNFVWGGWSMNLAPVVAGDYVLANYQGRLVAFNLASKTLAWELGSTFSGQAVVKGDQFYIINNGVIEGRAIATGALVSTISGSNSFIGDPLLTNNLLFVRDAQNTYAYLLETGVLAWTLNNTSGGMLMAEGALVIFSATGVVAIDLEGDIDADGLPDWWEKRLHKNINPTADTDGDGLTGLQEFNLNTNPTIADTDGDGLLDGEESSGASSPLIADTDGDGLGDYAEIKTHLTDATKVDSDGDGLSDKEEISVGLNPLDGQDALADSDGDGFSNLHELRANTAFNDANSRPQASDWSRTSGNNQRNRYNPLMLDDSRFSERWSRSSVQTLNMPVSASDTLIMRTANSQLVGWDAGTGAEIWRNATANSSDTNLATQDGKLVYFTNQNGTASFVVVNAASGAQLRSKTLGNNSNNRLPILDSDTLYAVASSGRSFEAYSLASGNLLWSSNAVSDYFYNSERFLLGNNQLVAVGSSSLNIFSATNGSLLRRITLEGYIEQVMMGTRDNLIVQTQDGKLSSINTADGTRSWLNPDCPGYRTALGNGHVYVMGNNKLCVINEQTGALSWSMTLPYNWGSNNIVLTASHLFYSDGSTTYGLNLTTRTIAWSIAKGAAELSMGVDGTLYLFNGNQVTAVDTQGDTDNDGLLQWWERRYGSDLDPAVDLDSDGLSNLQEYTAKTNPLVADTDGDGLADGYELNTSGTNPLRADSDSDGLSDGAELNTHATNPLLADTDGDGLDDARELTLGLNPLDENDATADSDGDGFSNLDEIYSGTDHNSAASTPHLGDWAMTQGNAAHNGFQPYRLDEADFSLRWSKRFSLPISPVATGDSHVFVTQGGNYSSGNSLLSLNAVDGKQEWKQDLSQIYNISAPTFSAGQVVVQASNPTSIRRFNADSGAAATSVSLGNSFYASQLRPSVLGDTAYSMAHNAIVATRLDTGANLWSASVSTGNDMALNDQYLFYTYSAQIHALSRTTGTAAFSIDTQANANPNLVLGSRNNILTHANDLISYDIATRQINWRVNDQYYSEGVLPVAANGQVIYLSNGALTAVDEINGEQRWSWRPANGYLSSNIVATLSHIFIASSTNTYALSASTGELLWSYAAGGRLALGADGALYIQADQQLVAINLEGDSDNDGLPDWWERHYGLNLQDASDAALDLDADGLTNLEEFTQGTYADQTDSDGDQLSDADEVNTHHTDPTSIDSDGDSMRDDWEVSNGFNPLDAADRDLDSDGDGIPNYSEYLVGTDPNNALSIPPMFSAGVYSFEDANLPAGWVLSDTTTDVSISLNNASHGTKALQMRYEADIGFTGFFSASDFSLDVKANCDYAGTLDVYVDEQLMGSIYVTTSWASLKTVIPLGMHTISIRSNSQSCAIYLDNLVIQTAQTNTQLGVQFVSLYNNSLQFIDANKTLVRSLGTGLSVQDATVQSIASIGNEKLVALFGGNQVRLGVLDLATFNWRYFDGLGALSYYSDVGGLVAAAGNFAYATTWNSATNTGGIDRVNLTSGAITRFGSHNYTSIVLDSAGFIYAYSNSVVYKYNPNTLALVSQMNTVDARQILIDSEDRLIAVAYNEVIRYNAQRLIDQRVSVNSARTASVNDRNELLVINYDNQIVWYSADWQRAQTLAIPTVYLASFPQPDSDSDGLPDWWELANGLDLDSPGDAALDGDNDGLSALEEFAADTNPALDDTDGDLVNDGDEVNEFNTNPNDPDSDDDGLTDGEEVYQYHTNPLQSDSDSDSISDLLEVTHFMTDPNDTQSKPAALVSFAESFEQSFTGWITPANTHAGWTVTDGVASNGTKSLRSGAIGDSQNSAVEWAAVFNQSTLSFDARVSSESCCDSLYVYVDGELKLYVQSIDQWQSQSLPISAGFHTIKFVYQKDGGVARGEDAVWIDNIRVQ